MAEKVQAEVGKDSVNLAKDLTKKERAALALEITQWLEQDLKDRLEWENKAADAYKLWSCTRDEKNEPWEGASNVCVPILLTACNQFHGRAYQSIFAPPELVKVIPTEAGDVANAQNVQDYLNWQLMFEMEEFEEEFDHLLIGLPIRGTEFKKTVWDAKLKRPISEHASSVDVVVPYSTKKLRDARRIIHILYLHYDELEDRNDDGRYIDFKRVHKTAGNSEERPTRAVADQATGQSPESSTSKNHTILEAHVKLRLTGSKLASKKRQPYIATVDKDSGTLLRLVSKVVDVDGRIQELAHFTDYHFFPNPDGFYSFGFGHFLSTLNEMANTIFNQIFDAGSLTNTPFGFYSRRAGLRHRKIKLQPGQMNEVDDPSQILFPSMQRLDQVLFQVLGSIQQYSEHVSSNSDYLMGREAKGTKTPTAHGTQALIEQGLVTFGVITKRIFRQFSKELTLIHSLNALLLPEEKQFRVVGREDKIPYKTIKRENFMPKVDMRAIGDPSFASPGMRRAEASELYTLLIQSPLFGVDPQTGQVKNEQSLIRATNNLIKTFKTIDPEQYVPELPPPRLSPISENGRMAQGDAVEPQVGENHAEHYPAHALFKETEFFRSLPKEYQALVDTHMQKTAALEMQEREAREQLGQQQPQQPQQPQQQRPQQ